MLSRTVKDENDVVLSTENYTYDAAGNVTADSVASEFVYDEQNRLTSYNGKAVTYDLDGNMFSVPPSYGNKQFTYDSANRLLTANGETYTYNAEDVRIASWHPGERTRYTYDTNCKLSRLLQKMGHSTVKYVYGLGLIGEESSGSFKTYHFDFRGSTVAITDSNGTVTDTFKYDTYGKQIERTGTTDVIFAYNGKDGVVTDPNGLLYMRARYYSPEHRRFINADIVPGEISNAITLNRYAYANGNPVSNVDPFGLSPDYRGWELLGISQELYDILYPEDLYPDGSSVWDILGFSYDGTASDFRKLSANLPPNAYEKWALKNKQIAIYSVEASFPIVGHAVLYIRDEEGVWHEVQFGRQTDKKSSATVWNILYSSEEKLIKRLSQKKVMAGPIPFLGDFSKSLDRVDELVKNAGNNGYDGEYCLPTNNCLHFVCDILQYSDNVDKDVDDFFVLSTEIAPITYYNALRKVTLGSKYSPYYYTQYPAY